MTEAAPAIRSSLLEGDGISHGFFTREGGVSEGLYASLNGGVGSRDAPEAVAENKRRMALTLGVPAHHLLIPYLIHSAEAVAVDSPWSERPRCDGVATATRGLALGVTGADCGIVLFCDPDAGVIAAAHAGWKGALDGVLDATLEQMERLGASRPAIRAVLGPTIGKLSYEVGPEFVARFIAVDPDNESFFRASQMQASRCSTCPATSARAFARPELARLKISISTRTRTSAAFIRTDAPFTATSRTSGGLWRRSPCPPDGADE